MCLYACKFYFCAQGKRGKRCIVFEDYLRKRWEIVNHLNQNNMAEVSVCKRLGDKSIQGALQYTLNIYNLA